MKMFLKGDLINYFISNFIPLFVNLILVYTLTSFLSPKEYGTYNIIITTATILVMFIFEWLSHAIMRFYYSYLQNKKIKVVWQTMNFYLLILFGLLLIFLAIIFFKNTSKILLLLIIIIYIFTSGYIILIQAIIKAQLNSQLYLKSVLISNILNLIICFLFLINNFGLWGVIISKCITNIIVIIYTKLKIEIKLENIVVKNNEIKKTFKKFFAYGFPIILTGIGATGLKVGDRYIIDYFLTTDDIGIYTSNYMISENIAMVIFAPLMLGFHTMLFNLYENGNHDRVKRLIISIKKIILIFFTPIVTYLMIFYTNSSKIFISEKYISGSSIIYITIIGIYLYNYSLYNFKVYEFKMKSILITKNILFCCIINIILNFILIDKIGIEGAAFATTISYLVFYMLSLLVNYKEKFLDSIKLNFILKLIVLNSFLFIIWKMMHDINFNKLENLSYFQNLIFVVMSSSIPYLIYILFSYKILKINKILKEISG